MEETEGGSVSRYFSYLGRLPVDVWLPGPIMLIPDKCLWCTCLWGNKQRGSRYRYTGRESRTRAKFLLRDSR